MESNLIPIPTNMWNLYQNDAKKTRGNHTRRLSKKGDPLFYILDEKFKTNENPYGLRFFGPTMMFRIPYQKSVHDHIIPDELTSGKYSDVAELMFGAVSDEYTIKGRVFFMDSVWDQIGIPFYEDNMGRKVPKELLEPKPTTFEHYLDQDPKAEDKLRHWDDEGVKIRGHKKYWHKNRDIEESAFRNKEVLKKSSKKRMATVMRPVKPKTRFVGKIRFENLTNVELGALAFVLNLPSSMRHKMGMGKPLGMGSVRIIANPHVIDPQTRYSSLMESTGLESGEIKQSNRLVELAANDFAAAMLAHYEKDIDDLWLVPRMRALAALLEWDNPPSSRYTQYMDLDEFQESKVLPVAEEVKEKYS
jgi:CRISPR-associated protein (TIGR03986 family)